MNREALYNTFKRLTVIVTFLAMTTSCVPGGTARSKRTSTSDQKIDSSGSGKGQGADRQNGSIDGSGLTTVEGKVDLKHIVDPFTGTYKTKVTIPKNYKGKLYLSGLNVTSLNSKIVKVRFRFGREYEEIVIPATIGHASGITPSTDVELLILDLEDQPFQNMRLLYDLYDYNDYDTNDDGQEFGSSDSAQEPTTNVRNSGLYCRGLYLEDDPTFTISSTNDSCDAAGEMCLYSYARILDAGLSYVNGTVETSINPSEPQVDMGSTGYANQSQAQLLKTCLPDVDHRSSLESVLQTTFTSSSTTKVAYGDQAFGSTYIYRGPYRSVSRSYWEIKSGALFSDMSVAGTNPSGLFQAVLNNAPSTTLLDPNIQAEAGIKSFLFPRAGSMSLQANIEYIGLTDLTSQLSAARTIRQLVSSGDTTYMDGCNLRISSYDAARNESVSSCSVTATIDIIYTNSDGNTEVITSSTDLKLQLTRASQTDFEGKEVRYSALNKCSNSNACGANECCFNERCWSKDLVSQCIEDSNQQGNLAVGVNCSSDYQCQSLCCSNSTGSCAVHNPSLSAYCNKSPGQQCVAQEFCREEMVQTCYKVKTGINSNGETTCALRCYYVPTYGDCVNGVCIAPDTPAVPTFDPADPQCSDAIDPPTTL